MSSTVTEKKNCFDGGTIGIPQPRWEGNNSQKVSGNPNTNQLVAPRKVNTGGKQQLATVPRLLKKKLFYRRYYYRVDQSNAIHKFTT